MNIELRTPSEIARFYSDNVTYDNSHIRYWHYRTIDEILEDGVAVCHDAGRFYYEMLTRAGYRTKRYFMKIHIPSDDEHEFDDENHSIVTFMHEGFYYHIEGTWWSLYGIHGPFRDIDSLLRNIAHLYKTVWMSDPINPAPLGLSFSFYEFNEEALAERLLEDRPIGINEFVDIVKGAELDIYKHKIELHDYKSEQLLVIIDNSVKAEPHSRALRAICDSKRISNIVVRSDENLDIPNIKERILYFIKVEADTYKLIYPPFTTRVLKVEKADLSAPIIEGTSIKWFSDDEEAMHRHKPIAKLLLQEMKLI